MRRNDVIQDIFSNVVTILQLYQNGMATREMLATELRWIRDSLAGEIDEHTRSSAMRHADIVTAAAGRRFHRDDPSYWVPSE